MIDTKNKTGEEKRLEALRSYDILDTLPDEEFDNLTLLASEIAGTKVAKINLVDDDRQWTKSMIGTPGDLKEIPRENSVCQHTIKSSDVTEIKNLFEDKRFSDFDYVKGEDGYRYYFGVPLITKNKHAIGSLCVLDHEEKNLSETQIRQLKIISNEVMTHLELHKQNRELEQLNEYKVRLMKMLTHDMRSPLNGIIGLSGMLREQMDDKNAEQIEIIDIIEQSSTQLNQMIDEVMNYSIIESGGLTLNPKEIHLKEVIKNIARLYRPASRIKNIDLEFYTEGLDEPLVLDGDKLEQVIGNLLSNAIKYTKTGGRVKLSLIRKRNLLELKISDSGIGMSEEELENIFQNEVHDPKSKGTSGEKSTGIGLSIVKHIIDLNSGEIDIESTPGEGTIFTVKIPL